MTDNSEYPDVDLSLKRQLVSRAFSPSSPITEKDLFTGRVPQLDRLSDIVSQRGQHALIYGDRGVGKTSLGRVVKENAELERKVTAYYTCNSGDTFASIFRGVLDEIQFTMSSPGLGFTGEDRASVVSARSFLPQEDPTPDHVRRALALVARAREGVIFIDEFDRPHDSTTRMLVADTVKILSDQAIPVTLVLVGVGSTVGDLLGEHQSVGRSLIQVHMPTMSPEESAAIVRAGMKASELDVATGFVDQVVEMSLGLPHYTHLIAQHGARYVVENERDRVGVGDVKPAIDLAIEDVSQSIREQYIRSTQSPRDTLYEDVLLACALAAKDDLGSFGSGDLRQPLKKITGRDMEIPAFSAHLNHFSSIDGPRGGILEKRGNRARFRYRFVDPLTAPYVLMKGNSADKLTK